MAATPTSGPLSARKLAALTPRPPASHAANTNTFLTEVGAPCCTSLHAGSACEDLVHTPTLTRLGYESAVARVGYPAHHSLPQLPCRWRTNPLHPPLPGHSLQALDHLDFPPAMRRLLLTPQREVAVELAIRRDSGEVREHVGGSTGCLALRTAPLPM